MTLPSPRIGQGVLIRGNQWRYIEDILEQATLQDGTKVYLVKTSLLMGGKHRTLWAREEDGTMRAVRSVSSPT